MENTLWTIFSTPKTAMYLEENRLKAERREADVWKMPLQEQQ